MELVKINKVKPNENNPRFIKDYKFKKLVQSIKEFPEMLKLRPIVVNADMVVLGGNMRLKASKEAGLKEVYVTIANDLTEQQEREFVIKDNVGFGDWDWDILANEWDNTQLKDWGMDVWQPDDVFELEEDEPEKDTKPSLTDDEHSIFEMIMLHENKLELIELLNQIKINNNLEKQEDALMVLVDYGKRSI